MRRRVGVFLCLAMLGWFVGRVVWPWSATTERAAWALGGDTDDAIWLTHGTDVVIVTLYDGSARFEGLADAALDNKLAYARRHDYGLVVVRQSLDPARHIVWSKIRAVLALCDTPYEFVVWIDLDALIQHQERPLSHIYQNDDAKIWVVGDVHGAINAGFFITRTGEWCSSFFEEVYSHWECEVFGGLWTWPTMNREQDAMAMVFWTRPRKETRTSPYGEIWSLGITQSRWTFISHYCNCMDCTRLFVEHAASIKK